MPGLFMVTGFSGQTGRNESVWLEIWDCGKPLYWMTDPEAHLPDMRTMELPNTIEQLGQSQICDLCPNQLACLAGSQFHTLTADLVRGMTPGIEYW